MRHLVRFPLLGGDCVVVQVEAPAEGPQPAANKTGFMRDALVGFEDAAGKLRPIAEVLINQVKDLGPDLVKLEFAIGFSAEAGLILASSGAEGHCKIELAWKKR